MHPPRWYVDRLRAMSLGEVAHRVREAIRPSRAAKLPAHLAHWAGPTFRFELGGDPATAEMILRGERELLGHGRVTLPCTPADPRLAWELERGHDWVAVAAVADRDPRFRAWLDETLAVALPHPESPMEAAIRIHSLVATASLTRPGPPAACATMIFEHARFVEGHLSAYSSANNHLVVELSALVVAARVLDDSARHVAALQQLATACADQIFEDGVHAEMATHYHAFVLEALAIVAYVEAAYGTHYAWLDRTIAAMSEYLAAITTNHGALLQQGDDDGGRIIPGFAIPVAAAEPISRTFSSSGQIVLRSPRLHVAFDAGPFGFGTLAAHAHCDCLAIYVACDGEPLLVDRGTHLYTGSSRDVLRATAAHNTVQVTKQEQAEPAGPFLWRKHPKVVLERCDLGDADIVVASHDGFAPATHRRTLLRFGDVLLVVDRADTALPITAHYHFAPGLELAQTDNILVASLGWCAVIAGDVATMRTVHSSQYGALDTAVTLAVTGTVELSCVIAPGVYDPDVVVRILAEARALGLIFPE
jgi:hypothetical protein